MTHQSIAQRWFQAFNAKDLQALLALYHAEAKHYSPKLKLRQPETGGLIRGKAALEAWWKDAFDRLPSLRYQPSFIISEGDRVFMEYQRQVDGEADITVGELLVIHQGFIVESKVYHS